MFFPPGGGGEGAELSIISVILSLLVDLKVLHGSGFMKEY